MLFYKGWSKGLIWGNNLYTESERSEECLDAEVHYPDPPSRRTFCPSCWKAVTKEPSMPEYSGIILAAKSLSLKGMSILWVAHT